MLPYKSLYEWCEAGRASSSKNLFGFEFFQLWHPGLLWALRGMAAWLVESLSTEKVICRMIDTVQKKAKRDARSYCKDWICQAFLQYCQYPASI